MENRGRPAFPQIHHNPSMPLVLANISITEWLATGAAGVFAGAVCFFSRHTRGIRGPAGATGAVIGSSGLLCLGYYKSSFRLMGYLENSSQVKRYPYRLDTPVKGSVPVVKTA
eukprot:CAMPEP_0114620896 /NCGR_PEP_ID=MMETSP0168-20121206/8958_1 /TAXON_ID=95228 ORGANISM="Vannella sp., Strain DIVA3 517/6/12" /NCGR_SAMPLE_ID=MMETSP0168 /ASSEMBLY_ACC=CAM_ASM_000044 /LENGTH=112 /DNA_ID=CAMNT_0001832095 /DNA_START=119 /DNA_END=457 /DNA_ORIENTATION=-